MKTCAHQMPDLAGGSCGQFFPGINSAGPSLPRSDGTGWCRSSDGAVRNLLSPNLSI